MYANLPLLRLTWITGFWLQRFRKRWRVPFKSNDQVWRLAAMHIEDQVGASACGHAAGGLPETGNCQPAGKWLIASRAYLRGAFFELFLGMTAIDL